MQPSKNKFASPEFSDVTDAQLQDDINEAMRTGNDEKVKKLINEQATRSMRKVQADIEANKKAEITKQQQKSEKVNEILDIVGQAANVGASVAGMFMSQNEGAVKKKAAAPGRLTKRTQEIMRKNAQFRKKRVQALARSQRYYA